MGMKSEEGPINSDAIFDVEYQEAKPVLQPYAELSHEEKATLFADEEGVDESVYGKQFYRVENLGPTTRVIAAGKAGGADQLRCAAWLPQGFALLGGGACSNWSSETGSEITGSYPRLIQGVEGWEARTAQAPEGGESTLDVWAIGMKTNT